MLMLRTPAGRQFPGGMQKPAFSGFSAAEANKDASVENVFTSMSNPTGSALENCKYVDLVQEIRLVRFRNL